MYIYVLCTFRLTGYTQLKVWKSAYKNNLVISACSKLCSSPTSNSQYCSHSLSALFIYVKKTFRLTSVSTYSYSSREKSTLKLTSDPIPFHNSLKMILGINTQEAAFWSEHPLCSSPGILKTWNKVFKILKLQVVFRWTKKAAL